MPGQHEDKCVSKLQEVHLGAVHLPHAGHQDERWYPQGRCDLQPISDDIRSQTTGDKP